MYTFTPTLPPIEKPYHKRSPTDLVYPPETWNPLPSQLQLWLDIQRGTPNVLAITHRQFGKDELFLKAVCCAAIQRPGNYVYCLPETEHVRKALWTAINPLTGISRIDEAFPPGLRLKKLDNEMIVELPCMNGRAISRVHFTGSDNHTTLRGMVGLVYVFSEWAFCDPTALAVLRPIVERNKGFMWFCTTSFGKNHAYQMLVGNRLDPNWACHLITNNQSHALRSSPLGVGIKHGMSHQLSPERMAAILAENIQLYGPTMGRAMTNQEYECSFDEVIPGSIFGEQIEQAEREGRVLPFQPDLSQPVYTGWDIGRTDDTAIWWYQIIDREIHIFDFHKSSLKDIPFYIEKLHEVRERYGCRYARHWLPHDAKPRRLTEGAGSMWQQMAAASRATPSLGSFSVAKVMDLQDQIMAARKTLPICRFHDTRCQDGLADLRSYHYQWDDTTKAFSKTPVHDFSSHASSGFMTLAATWRMANAPQEQPDLKPSLDSPTWNSLKDKHLAAYKREHEARGLG